MRRLIVPAPLRLLLVIAAAMLLCTWIDPYLSIGDSVQAQWVNATLPILLVLLVWGLSGRAWLALLVEVVVLGLLDYADHMKVLYLDSNLVYADFTIISGLLKDSQLVLGFVHPTAWKIVLIVALLLVAVVVAWFTRRWRGASAGFRILCLIIATIGFAVVATQRVSDVVDSLRWEVFTQANGARHVGIFGNVLLGRMTARDVKRPPDAAAEHAFWQEPLVRQFRKSLNEGGNGLRPDIVVIQSESLFEPSQLCGFADAPVLKHVAAQ